MAYLKEILGFLRKKKLIFFPVLLVIILIYLLSFNSTYDQDINGEALHFPSEASIQPQKFKYGFLLNNYKYFEDVVKKGESVYSILEGFGLSPATIDLLTRNTRDKFDFTQIRPKKNYMLLCSKDSTQMPLYFIYEKSPVEYVVFNLNDPKEIFVGKRKVEKQILTFGAKINSSLWNAIMEQQKSPQLAVKLEDVYKWTIDFFGIQKNDYFKLIYRQDFVEGKPIGNITPLAACFNHRNKDYYAFYFRDSKHNYVGFYNEKGKNVQRSFLKAPLRYNRVSSRFTKSRFHPVLRIYRPHHGVDYAAPRGTPVYSVSSGRIVKLGYQRKGAGRFIKIKHDRTLTTVYMHLSRFAKRLYVGKRVTQGQLIGYVGSTGLATGPHLDYRIYKNGKPINPLRFAAPEAKPIVKEKLTEFFSIKDSLMNELQAISIDSFKENISDAKTAVSSLQ